MNRHVFALCVATCGLVGCAPSPFQAAWYFGDTKKIQARNPAKSPPMYVALVNRSAEKQTVEHVIINRTGEKQDTGWTLALTKQIDLEPGDVIVRPADDFIGNKEGEKFSSACRVPVGVVVVTTTDPAGVRADMIRRLPSLLPNNWEEDCRVSKNEAK